ncbi:MAG: septal ring lytic transglycosylase RlpA family protein [Candidatus Riflebacteria bacterium]|nr:septal ring lytic transglycosylase RlpA family protein [Candidatus Riflebacteria bacterium]
MKLRSTFFKPLLMVMLLGLTGCMENRGGGGSGTGDVTDPGIYQTGIASWYGDQFQGRPTASGESFNMNDLTAAHLVLPFGTKIDVTNRTNGRRITVRINDRGPYKNDRIIDLSKRAAMELGMLETGVAEVELRIVSPS